MVTLGIPSEQTDTSGNIIFPKPRCLAVITRGNVSSMKYCRHCSREQEWGTALLAVIQLLFTGVLIRGLPDKNTQRVTFHEIVI